MEHIKRKTAVFMCRARQGGKFVEQIRQVVEQDVTKIIVEESGLKKQRDDLLAACNNWLDWYANHFEDFTDEVNGQLLCLANDTKAAIDAAESCK